MTISLPSTRPPQCWGGSKKSEEHLEERRQFFATWMARAISVVLSDEFAEYLFLEGDSEATWVTDLERVYVPKSGPYWRILLNGREVSYENGFDALLNEGDVGSLFPPGR